MIDSADLVQPQKIETTTRPHIGEALLAGIGIVLAYLAPVIPVGILTAPRLIAKRGVLDASLLADITRLALAWQTITYPLVFAIIYWFVRRNGGPSAFGFRRPTAQEFGLAMLATIAMIVVVDGSAEVLSALGVKMHGEAKDLMPTGSSPLYMALVLFLGAILAPLAEEGAFRIIALRTMMPRMPLWAAVAISSVLFAMAHISITTLLPLTLGGVVLAILYVRTGNAWLSMITHGTFNGIAIVATIANVGPR